MLSIGDAQKQVVEHASLRSNIFALDDPQAHIQIMYHGAHEHQPRDERIERQIAVNNMREIIQENPTVPVRRVHNRFVIANPANHNIPSFENIRASLNRERSRNIPPIPARIENVMIENEWAETYAHQRYLLHLNNDVGVAVFATDNNCRMLTRCETIYMDGTFRTAPAPYYQLYQFFTIHGKMNGLHVRSFQAKISTLTGKS